MRLIKANELRIGNFVTKFGLPLYVTGIFIARLRQIELEGKIPVDISTIPLTEEWLLKFWFKKTLPDYFTEKRDWYLERSEVGFTSDLICFLDEGNGKIIIDHIKYIHQLHTDVGN